MNGWNLLMAAKDVTSTRVWGFLKWREGCQGFRNSGSSQPYHLLRPCQILASVTKPTKGTREARAEGVTDLAESRLPSMQ